MSSLDEWTTLVPVVLADGTTVHVEARQIGERFPTGAPSAFPFEKVLEVLTPLSTALAAGIQAARPQKASVEFGIELAVEASGLVAVICKGGSKANLKLTLEWSQSAGKTQ